MNAARRAGIAALAAAIFTALSSCASVSTAETTALNADWKLCVTALDVSGLPASRKVVGEVVTRSLVTALETAPWRLRGEEELAWYRARAWGQDLRAAAKKVADKRQERDALVFQGLSERKLREGQEKIDKELVTLEEDWVALQTSPPAIAVQPAFSLTAENKAGTFPTPPPAGGEYFFCVNTAKSDGFLAGKISVYHERLYLTVRLYALFARSYIYEDSALFSLEDTEAGVSELAARLLDALAGTQPARLRIAANAPEAMIVVGGKFAGRGDTGPLETSPGEVQVTIYDDAHKTVSFPLELNAGEETDVTVDMAPLSRARFRVEAPDEEQAAVYRGALYAGDAPLEIDALEGAPEHITVENAAGDFAVNIFDASDAPLSVKLGLGPEPGLVEKRRAQYYASNTRFWFALPAAVFLTGFADPNKAGGPLGTGVKQAVYWGSIGVAAGFFVESLVRGAVYMLAANKATNPMAPPLVEEIEPDETDEADGEFYDDDDAAEKYDDEDGEYGDEFYNEDEEE